MRKGGVALIGMALSVVFIIVALFGSWYSVNIIGISVNIGLFGIEAGEQSVSYSDFGISDTCSIDVTLYLTLTALIIALLSLFGILEFTFKNSKLMKLIGGGFGIITFILALTAAFYFMASGMLGGEISFWNEFGGPGYAWYLMLIAGITALISSVLVLKKSTTPKDVTLPTSF